MSRRLGLLLLTQDHNDGAGNFKTTRPTVFIRSQPNVMRTFCIIVEYRPLLFVQSAKFLKKKLWHVELGVNRKIVKKCVATWKRLVIKQNEWKCGNCGPKNCTFHVRFFEFSLGSIAPTVFSSALCYWTAELLSSRERPSSVVVRPLPVRCLSSVDIVFSDTTEWINAKFWGQVPIHHISRLFQNFAFYFRFR